MKKTLIIILVAETLLIAFLIVYALLLKQQADINYKEAITQRQETEKAVHEQYQLRQELEELRSKLNDCP